MGFMGCNSHFKTMETITIPIKKGRLFTKENAREIGKLGGRPKGILNKSTIEAIKSKETFAKAIEAKAGTIAEALLQNLVNNKDTSAGRELLDRAFGKVPQGVQMQVATFSLKELAEYRKNLQNPSIEALPNVLQDDQKDLQQEPTEKAE